MKRKAFRTSGGKDRKAKKENFVFTISSEEETAMKPKEDVHTSDETPPYPSEVSSTEQTPSAEITMAEQHESAVCSEEEDSEENGEPKDIRAEDSPIPETMQEQNQAEDSPAPETSREENSPAQDSSGTAGKAECVPDTPLPKIFDGPGLAEIRKRCGVRLKEIADVTKISVRILEDIEAENYQALPPEVYARSFVRTYAKFLSLDSEKAVRDYMERYYAWKADSEKQKKRRKSSGSIFGIKIKKS